MQVDDELYSHNWLPGAHRLPPIDAFTQHRKLCAGERYNTVRGLRPNESAAVETLDEQAHPFTVVPKQFNQVTSAPTKIKTFPDNGLLSSALCTKLPRLM
jgi:hypothetical protein